MLQERIPNLSKLVEPDRVRKEVYTDAGIFEREMERIHESVWIYCGHESQVPKAGDYCQVQIGRQPMIMVRGKDKKVNVLHNRCPHRGNMIVGDRKGNTGDQILTLCERRLDNVIRRAGLTKTRPQARQGVTHGHFSVNGIKVTSPSYQLRPGDVVTIRPKEPIYNLYKSVVGDGNSQQQPDWITVDSESLRITMVGVPGHGDFSLPVDVNMVVEFLAR